MAKARVHVHAALEGLKEQLVRMGTKAEAAIDLAVQCCLCRNALLCSEVLSLESEINQCERSIDEVVIQLLVQHRPTSADLRLLTASMKINTNLQQISGLAVLIADQSMSDYRPRIDLPVDLAKIGETVRSMVRRALQTFAEEDCCLADAVLEMNDVVDRLSNDARTYLVTDMRQSPEKLDQGLAALMVMRSLERVAANAARITEDVLFWIHGTWPGVREPSRVQRLS
jgi:phosphate transport system protein